MKQDGPMNRGDGKAANRRRQQRDSTSQQANVHACDEKIGDMVATTTSRSGHSSQQSDNKSTHSRCAPRHSNRESAMLSAHATEFKPHGGCLKVPKLSMPCTQFDTSCLICATDHVNFVSVGPCEHPVCSLCAMRLRIKSHDKNCPICKQKMEFTVVYATSAGERTFDSFGIWGDSAAPGINVDHQSGMLFVDCESHYREMTAMRAIICPHLACQIRFPSEDLLLRHLKDAHGQTLCKLCITHRPLFLSEHTLMSPSQLKQHMNAPPGTLSGRNGDKAGGHPNCKFCNEHYYDTQELYKVS